MFEIDRSLKILAAKYPNVFQQILFGNNPDIQFLGVEDTAINIPEQRSDKVFKFSKGNKESIVSFEFLIRPESRELQNFYVKNALLTSSLHKPVITVIVYLERGKYRTFPQEYRVQLNGLEMFTRFPRILLWEYADQIRSGELKELAPLLVLFSAKSSKEIILEEKKLILAVSDTKQRSDLLSLAAMVAFRRFKNGLIKELFYEEYELMKTSNFIEEWIKESWEKGREEGRIKGIEEGREEGREAGREAGRQEGQKEGQIKGRQEGWREGRITLILNQLKKVLGRVSFDLETKISKLTDKEIEILTYDLLDMKAISDLETWLIKRDPINHNN
jgi:predicted transposase YdaD